MSKPAFTKESLLDLIKRLEARQRVTKDKVERIDIGLKIKTALIMLYRDYPETK